MPANLPNPKLFKPAQPRAPRLHGLFGLKNFRVHGFMEGTKWPPQALTDQYKQITNMLESQKKYKHLEHESLRTQMEQMIQKCREECRRGRLRLKNEQTCDPLVIRKLFAHDRNRIRLYSSMPAYTIVKHADDNAFVLRRERDKLRHELKELMQLYKCRLIEKSKIEDRIQYEREFRLPEEDEIIDCRVELENSETRKYTLSFIQRGYKRMMGILRRDEKFFEPVLNSLKEDVAEQEKFINLTLLVAYPVVTKKECILRKKFQKLESEMKKRSKQNANLLDGFKAKTAKENQLMITTVRNSMARVQPKNNYVRESNSMLELRKEMEQFGHTMKELQMITTVGQPKDIFPRFQMTDMILKNEMKEKEFKDTMYMKISDSIKQIRGGQIKTKFSFTDTEQTYLDTILKLKEAIKNEQEIQNDEAKSIAEIARNHILLGKTCYQILDILRHVDQPMKPVKPDYPNRFLKLPLLEFDAKSQLAIPPQYREEKMEAVMAVVLDKIRKICKKFKDDLPVDEFPQTLKQARNIYADIVEIEDEVGIVFDEEKPEGGGEPLQYPGILTSKQIKQQGMRLVDKAKEAKALAGL